MKKIIILMSIVLSSCGIPGGESQQKYSAGWDGIPACAVGVMEQHLGSMGRLFSKSHESIDNLTQMKLLMHGLDFYLYEANGQTSMSGYIDNSILDAHIDALAEDLIYWENYKYDFANRHYSLTQLQISLSALDSQFRLFEMDYRSLCSTVGFRKL